MLRDRGGLPEVGVAHHLPPSHQSTFMMLRPCQEFPYLVEGVILRVVGHRRSVSLGWLAPSKEPAMACRFQGESSAEGRSATGYARRCHAPGDQDITETMMH
jgi:hypothetical protein